METILPTSLWKLWSDESCIKAKTMPAVGLKRFTAITAIACIKALEALLAYCHGLWIEIEANHDKIHLFPFPARFVITLPNIAWRSIKHNIDKTRWHDDVIKWKHFPRYCPFARGNHRSSVNSPHKSQWRGALMCSLISAWTNSRANNGDAGDLRRNHAHYDVTVIVVFDQAKAHITTPSPAHYTASANWSKQNLACHSRTL